MKRPAAAGFSLLEMLVVMAVLIVTLAVLFAPEIRDMLARAAPLTRFREIRLEEKRVIQEVVRACTRLRKKSLGALIVASLIQAFGGGVSWGHAFAIYPVAVLAGLVPLTVSGIGTRDAAFVFLLSGLLAAEEATFVGLGYTLFAYWILSLVSLPVLFAELLSYLRGRAGEGKTLSEAGA